MYTMTSKGVIRPGHIQLRVLDLDKTLKHYTDILGLKYVCTDDSGRVYLKGWDEYDKFSVVLRLADEPGMDFKAYKVVNEEAMRNLEKELIDFGCKVERIPAGEMPGTGERVRFDSPTGHIFEIYHEKEVTGTEIGHFNPEAFHAKPVGMDVTRFDHCLLYGPDLDGTVDLFTKVLGFNLSETVMDGETRIAAFLTVSNKPHDVAFIRHAEPGKLHHVGFFLESWEKVLHAADLISANEVSLDIGPTRHGLTRGMTIYAFDPSGNRFETYAGGSTYYPDSPVVTWTADNLGKAIFYHARELNERFLTVLT